MKVLIKKDWRLLRPLLITTVGLTTAPYLLTAIKTAVNNMTGLSESRRNEWRDLIQTGSGVGLLFGLVMCAFSAA
jgi:hypothetical protein